LKIWEKGKEGGEKTSGDQNHSKEEGGPKGRGKISVKKIKRGSLKPGKGKAKQKPTRPFRKKVPILKNRHKGVKKKIGY